jgi:CRAL/TRIO domain
MMSTHYPQRSYKIMILNAPGFLNGAFAAVKSMLSESTRAKIAMVPSSQTTAEMLQVSNAAVNVTDAVTGTAIAC